MLKKNLALIFALILAETLCFAGQISVQIVQHNLSLDYVSDQSLIVEDEILNGFFDQGYIVTNSIAAVSNSAEMDASLLTAAFGEAYDGFSDYFVQVKLFYDADSNKIRTASIPCPLAYVELVVMNVKTGKVIQECTVKGSSKKPGTDENVRIVSGNLISEIKKAL